MYNTKQQDYEKRRDREGSYSPYNYMYKYLMDNYEPEQLNNKPSAALEQLERKLFNIGKKYCIEGGSKYNEDELVQNARQAIANFVNNKGSHGDTAHTFGKGQSNSLDTIKRALSDLRW